MSEAMKLTAEDVNSGLFKIEDDQTAEWAMTQIRNANEEKAKWKEFYDSRYQAVCASCDATIANMESMLQTYFETVPHKKTKTQENYALPSGKLVVKKQEPEYERDDEQIIAWLESKGKGLYVKTKKALDWVSLKSDVMVIGETVTDLNGEIIPGIKATERPDVFKVELKKE